MCWMRKLMCHVCSARKTMHTLKRLQSLDPAYPDYPLTAYRGIGKKIVLLRRVLETRVWCLHNALINLRHRYQWWIHNRMQDTQPATIHTGSQRVSSSFRLQAPKSDGVRASSKIVYEDGITLIVSHRVQYSRKLRAQFQSFCEQRRRI